MTLGERHPSQPNSPPIPVPTRTATTLWLDPVAAFTSGTRTAPRPGDIVLLTTIYFVNRTPASVHTKCVWTREATPSSILPGFIYETPQPPCNNPSYR